MTSEKRSWIQKGWRLVKRVFWIALIAQWVYLIALKWINPPVTLTQIGSLLSGDGLHRSYVPMRAIDANAKLAVIASEDQLFPDHDGFDFQSIEKAIKHNQKSKSLHGASTISQQVAKNIFLWQGRSFLRKGLEVYFTFLIEWLWGKKRILELYLNEAEMGKGVFGIEAASRRYFGKSAKSLSRSEAAMIAACLPNPKVFTIKPLSHHVAVRTPWILTQMQNLQEDEDIRALLQ